MELGRSPTHITREIDIDINCGICKELLEPLNSIVSTKCKHAFHESCLSEWLSQSPTCPNCRASCAIQDLKKSWKKKAAETGATLKMHTRSSGKVPPTFVPPPFSQPDPVRFMRLSGMDQNDAPLTPTPTNPGLSLGEIHTEVKRIMLQTQHEIMQNLQTQIAETIRLEMAAALSVRPAVPQNLPPKPQNLPPFNVDVPPLPPVGNVFRRDTPHPQSTSSNVMSSSQPFGTHGSVHSGINQQLHDNFGSQGNSHPRSYRSPDVQAPDRIATTMKNWNLQFSGSRSGLSVENFIYRVEVLTRQTLDYNFNSMCDHIQLLFMDKALDWFWRYHKRTRHIRWPEFSYALRNQFHGGRPDSDIMELIRNLKQKPNETFEDYFKQVLRLTDKLYASISESELLPLVIKNLRTEIRKDLLYVQIFSLDHLKNLCRQREQFIDDLRSSSREVRSYPVRNISELTSEIVPDTACNLELEISAVAPRTAVFKPKIIICWNCKKEGHGFPACLLPPRLFCWGCGRDGVYRPQCETCSPGNSKASVGGTSGPRSN